MYVYTYVCMGVPKSKNLSLKLILDSYEYIPEAYETMYCMIINMGQLLALFYVIKIFIYIK